MSGNAPFWNTTHWSMIFAAGKKQQTEGEDALNRLLREYRQPCVKHLEHGFSLSTEKAEDWFHDFVENKILKRDLIGTADPSKGRFRDLLRTSLTRFGIDQTRLASKREHLEHPLNEEAIQITSSHNGSPDPFTTHWIKSLLHQAMERTREHYEKKNRAEHWEAFHEGFVLPKLHGTKAPSRKALSAKYGFGTESRTNNILLNVSRYFRQTMISLLTRYSHSETHVEEEWESIQQYLLKATEA